MSTKSIIVLGLKIVILAFLLFVCYSIASVAVALTDFAETTGPMGAMSALLIVCAFQTIVLSYPIIRSRWTALALPVIRMMKGRWWEAGLAVALLFSVLMGFLLLLPNPYMPDTIRMAHFVEVSLSNFLFGWVVVWLLNRHHGSLPELSKWSERTG